MMNPQDHILKRTNQSWEIDGIYLSHNVLEYSRHDFSEYSDDSKLVRLHYGLKGSYSFTHKQLDTSFDLSGHHNNMLYSDGFETSMQNNSLEIETFGVSFTPDKFIELGQNGNDVLKRFTEKVAKGQQAILHADWQTNPIGIQQVIQEIVNSSFSKDLQDLFLLSKSIELLVRQAELYRDTKKPKYIRSKTDKAKLIDAHDHVTASVQNPPSISELSRAVGINDYKLKKGFKELFGMTVFGYIHHLRMEQARRLLIDTKMSAQEIAWQVGYGTPQHFSNAFKKTYGVTPLDARNNPDSAIKH